MSNNNQNSQRVDADSNHIVIHHWKDPEGSSSGDSSSGPIPSSGHFAIGYQEGVKHSIKGLYPSSKKDILGGQGEIKDDFEKVKKITETPELAKKWNYHGEKIPLSKSEIANVAEVVAKRGFQSEGTKIFSKHLGKRYNGMLQSNESGCIQIEPLL